MDEPPPVNRRQSLSRLAIYGAGVFGLPILRRNANSKASNADHKDEDETERGLVEQNLLGTRKAPFAQAPLKALLKAKPEFVVIGDSMVRAHIDAAELSKLSGRRVSALWLPNSTSARWYLLFKNYALNPQLANKPKRVVFCFRNCLWNMPTFRVDGPFWDDIERLMPEPKDEVISRILGPEPRRDNGILGRVLREQVYRVQFSAGGATKSMQKKAAALSGNDLTAVQKLANERFHFQNFRAGINAEEASANIADAVPFSDSPGSSFLPHVIELAQQAGISLYFVRIKRRPRQGSDSHDLPEMRSYIHSLKSYITSQGCGFYDFTDDPDLKVEMYAEGDHLADQHTTWFSRHLFEKIGKEVFA